MARRARSRAGCSRSSGSGVAEAERSAGPEPCAPGEASWAAGGEPPAAALEKAGSGGVATWCPRPSFPAPLPARGRKGGGKGEWGSGREVGDEGVQALDATTLARRREGPKRAQGAQYSRYRAEERGFRERKWEMAKPRAQGSAERTQTRRTDATPRPLVPPQCPLSCPEGARWLRKASGAVLAGGA